MAESESPTLGKVRDIYKMACNESTKLGLPGFGASGPAEAYFDALFIAECPRRFGAEWAETFSGLLRSWRFNLYGTFAGGKKLPLNPYQQGKDSLRDMCTEKNLLIGLRVGSRDYQIFSWADVVGEIRGRIDWNWIPEQGVMWKKRTYPLGRPPKPGEREWLE